METKFTMGSRLLIMVSIKYIYCFVNGFSFI